MVQPVCLVQSDHPRNKITLSKQFRLRLHGTTLFACLNDGIETQYSSVLARARRNLQADVPYRRDLRQ